MTLPIRRSHKWSITYLVFPRKNWMIKFFFTELSNQVTQFPMVLIMWDLRQVFRGFFFFFVNCDKDTSIYIFKIFSFNPRPSLLPQILYLCKKIAVAFYLYLAMFKLNLKVCYCCSIIKSDLSILSSNV